MYSMLKKHAPKMIKTVNRDFDEKKTCQICDLEGKLDRSDGCVDCKLDCCAWDFEKIKN